MDRQTWWLSLGPAYRLQKPQSLYILETFKWRPSPIVMCAPRGRLSSSDKLDVYAPLLVVSTEFMHHPVVQHIKSTRLPQEDAQKRLRGTGLTRYNRISLKACFIFRSHGSQFYCIPSLSSGMILFKIVKYLDSLLFVL